MIVYDKEQKEIVIPNGIGNINLYNNGVEAGYNQGKIDGIEEQKSKLESIIIVNNGRYTKEDGYKAITVNVPDRNGSYNEGYEQAQIDMESNARVLNVTENGVYRSKFSNDMPPIAHTVTGVYADGTEFHSCAELNGKIFNTKIAATIDSRLEFWYKGDYTLSNDVWNVIIGAGNNDNSNTFQVRYFVENNDILNINLGNDDIVIDGWDDRVWHHLIVSKAEGLWIDGEKKRGFSPTNTINGEFFINGINYDVKLYDGGRRTANGYFGMIKIDDVVIIPTANGFLNTNTGELLEVVKDGGYTFTENDPIYGEGELYKTINVNVPDLNGSYDEGYAQGKIDGANEQKSKLESISITENGTYNKEDGYNHIEVNVPDLNGSYDEGYTQGQADVAANARVLNVTENGNYLSKFSDPIIPANVTGVYADGTKFYSYAQLNGKVFNTGIKVSENTKIEIWYKPRDLGFVTYGGIIGPIEDTSDNAFNIHTYIGDGFNNSPIGNVFNGRIKFYNSYYKPNELDKWFHLELSFADGFVVDGVVVGTYTTNTSNYGRDIYINKYTETADGYYGMIKIDNTIIIPTEEGFLNTSTGELLEVVENGSYVYTNNEIIQGEGELYKTINVNVIPKINLQKEGIKLAYGTFTEVPEWADFEGITDMSYMFQNCSKLQTISSIDTSNVTNMERMFQGCENLQTIPLIDTSNVINMSYMFQNCSKLQTIPSIKTSNVVYMDRMFYSCTNLKTLPKLDVSKITNMMNYFRLAGDNLTDVGGWENLKCDWNDNYGLVRCPNLTYQSCINILNGLYDFVGNGSTETRTLKVNPNFLTTVGDKISIGTSRGWVISA